MCSGVTFGFQKDVPTTGGSYMQMLLVGTWLSSLWHLHLSGPALIASAIFLTSSAPFGLSAERIVCCFRQKISTWILPQGAPLNECFSKPQNKSVFYTFKCETIGLWRGDWDLLFMGTVAGVGVLFYKYNEIIINIYYCIKCTYAELFEDCRQHKCVFLFVF